jgi:hypothetical protein
MNTTRNQSLIIGAALIGLGLVWWLNLWWLVLPGVLAAVGAFVYTNRRATGRTIEAVQSGIWAFGLAIMALVGFLIPGLLIVAGLSFLARGKEDQIDAWVQSMLGKVNRRRGGGNNYPIQRVPVTPASTPPEHGGNDIPISNETARLRD